MKIVLTFIALLISLPSFACRPNTNYIDKQMRSATGVYIGQVTGLNNVSYEEGLREGKHPDRIQIPERIEMRIFVTQTIKGKAEEVLYAKGAYCGYPSEIRDKVYVFKHSGPSEIFATSEENLKYNHKEVYEQISNKAVKVDSAEKTPHELH